MSTYMAIIRDGNAFVVTPGEQGIERRVERDELGRVEEVSLTAERPLEVTLHEDQGPVDLALALGLDIPEMNLDSLKTAWVLAEVPTDENPIREGDVVIYPMLDGYVVRTTIIDHGPPTVDTRIRVLTRAPQREPWADLEEVLRADHGDAISEWYTIREVAQALHAKGVRVVEGGDE